MTAIAFSLAATLLALVVASLGVRACMVHGLPRPVVVALVDTRSRLALYTAIPLLTLASAPAGVVCGVLLVMLDRHVHKSRAQEKN